MSMLDRITNVDIADAMTEKYREYATTVVVSRALPDVRDGLKPVHRRILYGMFVGGYDWTKAPSKSARIVGDVMGRYHPHGDSSIYDAMARLTQPWSLSVPLIEGQGNFGSPDGDGPAAMRYTEAKLAGISRHMVDGLRENTVDFKPNYDERDEEPVVLPAAFPNVLVNAGSGIAVGMASSIPTHNLREVIDATILRMRDPACSLDDVMAALPAPDFPTGGRIMGLDGARRGYETGRGSVTLEATMTPDKDGRTPILVYTDVPWGVSKTDILAKIKDLIEKGAAPEVTSARDETGRAGVRFVVEMRQGSDPERVDAFLKSQTDLRVSVPINMTLLDQHGVPREMGLLDILDAWIGFRRTTLRRRFNNELGLLRDKGRLLLGRMAALSMLDKVIRLIRESPDRASARQSLMGLSFPSAEFSEFIETLGTRAQRGAKRFALSGEQADHILEMRLQRLTGLERDALVKEGEAIIARMRYIREVLAEEPRLDQIIIEDLTSMRSAYGTERRSEIAGAPAVAAARAKSAPPPVKLERVRVLVDHSGALIRAGKADPGPFVAEVITDTHSRIVAFLKDGRSFSVAPSDLPSADAREPFRSLTGILGTKVEGEVASFVSVNPAADQDAVLCFVSEDGAVRRTAASEFFRVPQTGKSAMGISDADPRLLTVFRETPEAGAVFIGTSEGKVIRFALEDVRVMAGRGSRGVRGISLTGEDKVVSAFEVPSRDLTPDQCDEAEAVWMGKKKGSPDARALAEGPEIVQVSVNGYRKRTLEAAYRQTNRANRGVNDKGPSKGIGPISGWAMVGPGVEQVVVRTSGGAVRVDVGAVKKGARASTGSAATEI